MYDLDLTLHILDQIHKSVVTISKRFKSVRSVNDFTDSPRGIEKLDAICMQLIVIGESLKNLDKVTDRELLKKYSTVKADPIDAFRGRGKGGSVIRLLQERKRASVIE